MDTMNVLAICTLLGFLLNVLYTTSYLIEIKMKINKTAVVLITNTILFMLMKSIIQTMV